MTPVETGVEPKLTAYEKTCAYEKLDSAKNNGNLDNFWRLYVKDIVTKTALPFQLKTMLSVLIKISNADM
jgi:hypothetical protein